jgi:polyisoprenyl-phosphate glycosyltransferase
MPHEISIVIPVKDEEKNIPELISRIFTSLEGIHKTFEIIFVTDTNKDNTDNLLRDFSNKFPNVKTIKLANSFGQHVAVMAGLDHCYGEYVVIMDGDLQDFPEDIPLLYNKICEGFDIVYAVKERKNTNYFRNLISMAFNYAMNLLSDIKITSNSSMFRIISKRALTEVIKFREYEPSLTYIFGFINLPTSTVVVRSGVRQQGVTKYNLFQLNNYAVTSILSFSRKPLRLISNMGFIMSIFSFVYFAIVIFQHFFMKIEILGWATIIAITTFMGGIQLLSLGVIGEYIGRIYMQTKNRPLYIIEERLGNFDQ